MARGARAATVPLRFCFALRVMAAYSCREKPQANNHERIKRLKTAKANELAHHTRTIPSRPQNLIVMIPLPTTYTDNRQTVEIDRTTHKQHIIGNEEMSAYVQQVPAVRRPTLRAPIVLPMAGLGASVNKACVLCCAATECGMQSRQAGPSYHHLMSAPRPGRAGCPWCGKGAQPGNRRPCECTVACNCGHGHSSTGQACTGRARAWAWHENRGKWFWHARCITCERKCRKAADTVLTGEHSFKSKFRHQGFSEDAHSALKM